jgi:O-acetyl-ADP-ribose deacetylase (regulator of RNase III)
VSEAPWVVEDGIQRRWLPTRLYRWWRARRDSVWRREAECKGPWLGGYRVPVQVCPRGCGYDELARRDLVARTRLWGRVDLHSVFDYESDNCPKCGAPLARTCVRCKEKHLAPVSDLCRNCGLPQPWALERRAGAERASVRHWHPDVKESNDPAEFLYGYGRKGDLWVIDGELARLDVNAVISNDDVEGQMWAQVARSIKVAAGAEVEQRAQDGRPYKLGQAWWTKPGDLAMDGIIHVASMNRRGETSIEIVRECLTAALAIATKEKCASIGMAAIGTGPKAIDPALWNREFADLMVRYLSNHEGIAKQNFLSVVLVLFDQDEYAETVEDLRGLIRKAWHEIASPAAGYFDYEDRPSREEVSG